MYVKKISGVKKCPSIQLSSLLTDNTSAVQEHHPKKLVYLSTQLPLSYQVKTRVFKSQAKVWFTVNDKHHLECEESRKKMKLKKPKRQILKGLVSWHEMKNAKLYSDLLHVWQCLTPWWYTKDKVLYSDLLMYDKAIFWPTLWQLASFLQQTKDTAL